MTGQGAFVSLSLRPSAIALDEFKLPGDPRLLSPFEGASAMWKLVKECFRYERPDEPSIEGLAYELMGLAAERSAQDRNPPPWLNHAIELLEAISAAPQSMRAIGREVGVDPIHLARTFRRFHHCTPGEFRTANRVRTAAALLTDGKRSLAEIAASCGFADQSHFSHVFRRAFGVSPDRYRLITRS